MIRENNNWTGYGFGLVLAALCLLLAMRDPLLPGAGLDPSWHLANEFAAKHALVFGRDYVFNYGPYHFLGTRLFDPATYSLVLLYDAFAVLAVFWVAVTRRSVLVLVGVTMCVITFAVNDTLVVLTFYGVFLFCLARRDLFSVVAVAICAPLLLAKLSFGLVILPLMLLADAQRVLTRKTPILTAVLLTATLTAYVASGQPLSGLGSFVSTAFELILGYGRAMQLTGPRTELVLTVVLTGVVVAFAGAMLAKLWWEGTLAGVETASMAAMGGLLWVLFILFKMGFVRQDGHTLIFHGGAPAAFALFFAFLDRRPGGAPRWRLAFALLFMVMFSGSFYWRSYWRKPSPEAPTHVAAELGTVLKELPQRVVIGFDWLTGLRWKVMEQARRTAEEGLARTFPSSVTGTVDAVPWEVAPLIASKLAYHPRPVVQSYSSYTPALQALDRLHFAGPDAPDTLLLQVQDMDSRLPTLALGPSLPIIGQRYDAVGSDPLGLILKRRSQPRQMVERSSGSSVVVLDRWVPARGSSGHLLMARIKVQTTLAGRLVGLLYREPLMTISLKTASGRTVDYRFIPGMATLGVGISPVPSEWSRGAPMLLDPQWTGYGDPITALRLTTNGKNWAFGRISVEFQDFSFAPGFAARLEGTLPLLISNLLRSDPKRGATYNGQDIFAHAPVLLSAPVHNPLHLSGVVGLYAQPPGSPPGDGVHFTIRSLAPDGASRVLFDQTIRPGEQPVGFDVQLPAGVTLQMVTAPLQNGYYDWSYWGKLKLASDLAGPDLVH